jgi:phosphatidylserine/phosphatidylglycerophosphate/cardiolipin synthase-like enzyme
VSVEGELMYVYDESTMPNAQPQQMKAFVVERGNDTRIVSATSGAYPRQHKAGAPATVVDLTNIYVHAKMMIVDDVFLGLGSANLNHRGLFYDGEINCFTIPEALRTSPRNPAFALRQRLWAEMMDLPAAMAASLLSDPIAAAKLFGRSPFAGNRFTPLDAQPYHLMASFTSSDTWVSNGLQALGFGIIAANIPALFAQVVDPSSRTETDP